MNNQNKKQYKRHSLNVKYYAVKMYTSSSNWTIKEVCNRYKISSSSLMRWVKKYNGNRNSLKNESSKPKSKHPLAHNDKEVKNINNLLKRNTDITLTDLWIKLTLNYNYNRPQSTLYRYLRTNKIRYYKDSDRKKKIKANKRKGKYHIAKNYCEVLAIDTKKVPSKCKCDNLPHDKTFTQYTCIEESSRLRFIYFYDEKSIFNSINFIKRAIEFYGYIPKVIVSDNGVEFLISTYKTKNYTSPFIKYLENIDIKYKTTNPQCPTQNIICERSHRFDNQYFYKYLKFYSLEDLRNQGKQWLKKYNNRPFLTLDLKSPNQLKAELIKDGKVTKRKLKSLKELKAKDY